MTGQPFALIHLLAGLFALGVATIMTPIAGRIAGRVGLVAYPKRDRWHRSPTPLLGGIGERRNVAQIAATHVIASIR